MNAFNKTLQEMNNEFTSNEFSLRARENGATEASIVSGRMFNFLLSNTYRDGKRLWRKKKAVNFEKDTNDEEKAVALLKSLNYKILKPVSEWKEV